MDYLTAEHADAFVDFPETMPKHWDTGATEKCPACHGHGGWNLRLNAYPLPPGMEDTAHNRHLYVHFRCHCVQCHGYGTVTPAETVCVHDYSHRENVGNCLNKWVCVKCGKSMVVDSSD